MNIGKKLKELRVKRGYTQEEVAIRVGLKKAAINKYETGTVKNIKIETIEKLAEVLNVSKVELLGWSKFDELKSEVFVYEEISKLYGEGSIQLLENYQCLNDCGKSKLEDYLEDLIKLYRKDV